MDKATFASHPNKHLLITGANRGIGLALTTLYLNAGWQVDACCRDPESADELNALTSTFDSLQIHELDVTDHAAIDALSTELTSREFDLIINNAGYYGPKGDRFGSTDMDEWRKVLDINTLAPLKIAEAFHGQLLAGKPGVYAALSSKVGSMTDNTSGGGYIYRSSKAALNAVVKSLSIDLAPQGIIAVALHPGWVKTEMGGPNALISSQESAQGLFDVLAALKHEDSGKFLNYDGQVLPW
ncbi:SDR family oxidoreductase [Enterovibrio baiacu]|uniref:SDR family oxidoreductase n=1 Tax=Enterovibrio baiacu TaxID=2491023 RepID=UPI0010105D38|nr:SDR family oxidoreductase [Enterovibrio baiacu]MBE1275539.1 SDR family oxidoreductase [Enterovibrio baiacu]